MYFFKLQKKHQGHLPAKDQDHYHLEQIGKLIEENETLLRTDMDSLLVMKTKEVNKNIENVKKKKKVTKKKIADTKQELKKIKKKKPVVKKKSGKQATNALKNRLKKRN